MDDLHKWLSSARKTVVGHAQSQGIDLETMAADAGTWAVDAKSRALQHGLDVDGAVKHAGDWATKAQTRVTEAVDVDRMARAASTFVATARDTASKVEFSTLSRTVSLLRTDAVKFAVFTLRLVARHPALTAMVVVAVLTPGIVRGTLGLLGFAASGVVRGWQSRYPDVPAGSPFAAAQSMGATGVSNWTGLKAAVVVGALVYAYQLNAGC